MMYCTVLLWNLHTLWWRRRTCSETIFASYKKFHLKIVHQFKCSCIRFLLYITSTGQKNEVHLELNNSLSIPVIPWSTTQRNPYVCNTALCYGCPDSDFGYRSDITQKRNIGCVGMCRDIPTFCYIVTYNETPVLKNMTQIANRWGGTGILSCLVPDKLFSSQLLQPCLKKTVLSPDMFSL